jgi:hypothetical protein
VNALVSRAPASVWAYDFRLWDALDLGSPVPASTAAPSADLTP